MQSAALLHIVACHIVVLIAFFLIIDRRYEDGCVGRLSLVVMIVACLLVLVEFWLTDVQRYVRPPMAWLAVGMAIFITRHAYRHWRFGRKRTLASSGLRVHA